MLFIHIKSSFCSQDIQVFVLTFWSCSKMVDNKDQVNSKFYDVTPWLTNNYTYTWPNISKSKDNQAMKFSQLIECNVRNIFLEKSYTKCGGETSPRLFSENIKLIISLNPQPKVLYSLFLLYVKLMAIDIH